jgi:flagellar basal-body rod modification protein FlgD
VAINPTTAAGVATAGATPASQTGGAMNRLGKDAFLQLLVTKMQHQDPTRPVDDSELLGQLAQFSSLETLQEINQTLSDIGRLLAEQRYGNTTDTTDTTGGQG